MQQVDKDTVLVVDDELGVRQSFNMMLKGGYNMLFAETGRQAIDVFENNLVDLILLDINLPDINGIDLLKRFMKADPNPAVIMVSAVNEVQTAVKAIKLGAHEYIIKPFIVDEVLNIIKQTMKKRRFDMKLMSIETKDGPRFLQTDDTIEPPKDFIRKIAVLFTDVVGSTNYFKSYGDIAGREMLQRHQELSAKPISQNEGILVKTIGDSVMAYFQDPRKAVKSAITIQQNFKTYNDNRDPGDQIHIRIGIHFGVGIVEDKDIFGNVVNLAARLVSLAGGDQIFISQDVYDLLQDMSLKKVELINVRDIKGDLKGIEVYSIAI
jgi:class 3 adenylate cyclase